jgi:hypothetical protein
VDVNSITSQVRKFGASVQWMLIQSHLKPEKSKRQSNRCSFNDNATRIIRSVSLMDVNSITSQVRKFGASVQWMLILWHRNSRNVSRKIASRDPTVFKGHKKCPDLLPRPCRMCDQLFCLVIGIITSRYGSTK